MHIKITFTGKNAEDLSYLVNKNPNKIYEEEISYEKASVSPITPFSEDFFHVRNLSL